MTKNNKTRFFYVLYSADKTWVFDQSERAQINCVWLNIFLDLAVKSYWKSPGFKPRYLRVEKVGFYGFDGNISVFSVIFTLLLACLMVLTYIPRKNNKFRLGLFRLVCKYNPKNL